VAKPKRRRKALISLLVLAAAIVVTGAALWHPATTHLRAMSVLLRFSNPKAQGFVASFAQHPVKEETGSAQTPQGPLKFRLYLPQDVRHPGGVVLLHGIHNLGIEDPRLISLARAMSGAGVAVMTPQLQDLTEYSVTPISIDVIGSSATILSVQLGEPKVGIVGMSFAGGLALLAAGKPQYADKIGFVLAVGADDDMARVARFFVENAIETPDGGTVGSKAHEYGVLVFAYTHLEGFFSPEDVPAAREALRQYLWEKPVDDSARGKLSPAGRATFDQLLHDREMLHEVLLQQIKLHSPEMAAVSPHGKLGQLTVQVYLLHGAGDTLIPPSETQWLARDVPRQELKAVLISPALIHVDMDKTVTWSQQWALISFMASVLDATNDLADATASGKNQS
jgi:pimeloyl-ACP methyl ester carboxylesterase